MTSLWLPNNVTQLALHTHLLAEISNATRWSSVWKLVDKYVSIRDEANYVTAVEDLLPRGSTHHRILALHEKLKGPNSVCEKLQQPKRTLVEVHALFDACIKMSPGMSDYLAAEANIVYWSVLKDP
ncbi:hypothetical protein PR003_g13491 [Phytophthora rubi]|uniref:Uncharacterized protein n=1 Tax=Phytophthora rubi TaxID=129364 RepID=A0A6A3L7B9_9STRA|nr:hypothetical protein PR002_g14999 [Phytophthora rubi]KAE9028584.1 hypothetical protein PR001_g11706 [Phytophthora rubi]KAE9334502.1 hypothetical protein PR003_g13491 [Phytophthora rubi]